MEKGFASDYGNERVVWKQSKRKRRLIRQWLSTHPSHKARIRDLQDYAQRVLPLYKMAKQ